jgi:hypothetical protein
LISISLITAAVMFVGFMLYTRTSPFDRPARCPNCEVPYIELAPPADDSGSQRTYAVLACPQCTNTSTRVHGTPSRFAYCPSCRQRTLETPTRRLPPDLDAPLAVEVEERCHLCGHHDAVVLPAQPLRDHRIHAEAGAGTPPPHRRTVIPFPVDRRRDD